jgi:hypothetical protein
MTLLAPDIRKEWALPDDTDDTGRTAVGSNLPSRATSVDPSHPTQLIKKANNDAPANMLSHNELGDIDDSDDSDPDFGLLLQERSDGEDEEDEEDKDDGSRLTNKALRAPSPKKTIPIIDHYKDWDNGEPLSPEGCKHILSKGLDYERAQAMNKRCNQHKLRELEVKNRIRARL